MTKYRHPLFKVSYPRGSSISFRVALSKEETLQGSFVGFDATVVMTEPDLITSQIKMVLYTDTVKGQTLADTQKLMGPSCLDTRQYRVIKFDGKEWERITDNEYLLFGTLSMCGRSNLIVFEVIDHGISTDEHTNVRLNTLQFDGIIRRSDFNLAKHESFLAIGDEIILKGMIALKSEGASVFSKMKDNSSIL